MRLLNVKIFEDYTTDDNLEESMNKFIENAVQLLLHAKVHLIIYACVSGSFIEGLKGERAIRQKIETITKIPTITASMALINTLKYFHLAKVLLLTPYPHEIHMLAKNFFEENNIDVLEHKTLDISDSIAIGKTGIEEIYNLAKSFNNKNADSLVISCTNLKTFGIIDRLEEEIGIPVITSTQSILWQFLKHFKYKGILRGYGRIFNVDDFSS